MRPDLCLFLREIPPNNFSLARESRFPGGGKVASVQRGKTELGRRVVWIAEFMDSVSATCIHEALREFTTSRRKVYIKGPRVRHAAINRSDPVRLLDVRTHVVSPWSGLRPAHGIRRRFRLMPDAIIT